MIFDTNNLIKIDNIYYAFPNKKCHNLNNDDIDELIKNDLTLLYNKNT